MKNKAQSGIISPLIVFGLIMLAIIIILILSANVGYSIKISDPEIPKGVDITLSYSIENGLLLDSINNIEFTYSIHDENNNILLKDNISLRSIGPRSTYKNSIILDTSGLDRGEYTIWTSIDYYIGEGGQGIGNREAKHLSLKLTIY